MTDCKHFETCSAPICPKDPDSVRFCAWFPGEDICILRDVPAWVKRQRRIAKATAGNNALGCFTADMLAYPCMIRVGMKGLDPSTEITPTRVQKWLAERLDLRNNTPRDPARTMFKKVESRAERVLRDGVVKSSTEATNP